MTVAAQVMVQVVVLRGMQLPAACSKSCNVCGMVGVACFGANNIVAPCSCRVEANGGLICGRI
jgi:hypothetical protein